MKNMNKKKLAMFAIPILAVAIVTALAVLSFSVNVTTAQSIFLDSEEQNISCLGGETCLGSVVTIINNANVDADLKLVEEGDCEDVEVGYVGKLELTKKDTSTWSPVEPSDIIEIVYTTIGEDFEYDDSNLPEGYTLVYAMDKENRFNDYATVIKAEEIDESLPYVGDWNLDASPDYCDSNNGFDNYEHCVGAKLWAIDESDLGTETDGVYQLTWANMINYYYETDLVYYFANADNEITVPAGSYLEIYPSISPALLIEDSECIFTVTIDTP